MGKASELTFLMHTGRPQRRLEAVTAIEATRKYRPLGRDVVVTLPTSGGALSLIVQTPFDARSGRSNSPERSRHPAVRYAEYNHCQPAGTPYDDNFRASHPGCAHGLRCAVVAVSGSGRKGGYDGDELMIKQAVGGAGWAGWSGVGGNLAHCQPIICKRHVT